MEKRLVRFHKYLIVLLHTIKIIVRFHKYLIVLLYTIKIIKHLIMYNLFNILRKKKLNQPYYL